MYKHIPIKEASFYRPLEEGQVQCLLCPHRCILPQGARGLCGVRENREGKLYTLVYGRVVAWHVDPIEKKPFFHFLPASRAFSISTAGCNLRCKFCQNWDISQRKPEELEYKYISPEDVVRLAIKYKCQSISYTYTEPTIFYELMYEASKIAYEKKIFNTAVTNGYINEEPLRRLCKFVKGFNVDLKSFSSQFYENLCRAELEPVLNSLKVMQEESCWVEITNLVIPGFNDDFQLVRKMCRWIVDNLGQGVPLHFSRFWPAYHMRDVSPTPAETLERCAEIAREEGLNYVYIGNIFGHRLENTYCPGCQQVLIKRQGFFVVENTLIDSRCPHCSRTIEGVWNI